MSRTIINVSAVIESSRQINSAKTSVSSAKNSFTQTKNSIDGKIQNRSNIRDRLNTVQRLLSNIDGKIEKIRSTVQFGANQYRAADDKVEAMKKQVNASISSRSVTAQLGGWADYFKDRIKTDSVIDKSQGYVQSSKSIKSFFDLISNITKCIGKYGKSEKTTLAASFLGYFGVLTSSLTGGKQTKADICSSMLSLFKSSVGVESGIYKYYEKTLHPYEVSKLDARFGKAMTGLSLASSLAGTAGTGIDTYKIFTDPNCTTYDKAAQSIKMGGAVFDFGGKAYIASQASSKTLQFISSASGSSKTVNQILATEQKLKYTTSAAATKNISKANTILALGNVTASTISSGVKRYGEVTADGKFDMGDAGSVGVHGSLSGLNTVTSSLTLGIIHFDSEKVATDIERDADDFVRGDSWAAQYIRNQDNNVILRFGVSVGSGGYLLGKKVVNGAASSIQTVGSWVSTGWDTLTNLF